MFLIKSKKPCNTCPPPVEDAKARLNFDLHLKNIDFFVANFDLGQIPSGDKFFTHMRGLAVNGNPATKQQLHEMFHTLYELKRRGLTADNVEGFRLKYSSGSESDIKLIGGKHIELKNVNYNSADLNQQTIDQVCGPTGAFSVIQKMDDFEWVNYHIRDGSLDNLRTKWQNVFKNEVAEDGYTSTQIFNRIWNNDDLKASLFDNAVKSLAEVEFHTMINNKSSDIYAFIYKL